MRRVSPLSVVTRLQSRHVDRALSAGDLPLRGVDALDAARRGAELYVFTPEGWAVASPSERARAEELALSNPVALLAYGAMPPKRRRRRRR
jgi:hypothetical protein